MEPPDCCCALDELRNFSFFRTIAQHGVETQHGMEQGVVDDDDEELRKALALSRQDIEVEDEEADLRRAIQLSMQGTRASATLISVLFIPLSVCPQYI